jgi:glycyl-tRNA synthetase beta chain
MKNIIRQAREKSEAPSESVNSALLSDGAERALSDQSAKLAPQVEMLRSNREYRPALEQIATLRPHVDLFFDKVMVMVEDPAVRQNRLALIAIVLGNFSSIADFSEIVTG